jgi:membrane protein YdbS with pleckstrin-like domain
MIEAKGWPIHRDRVSRYFFWSQVLVILLVGIWFFGAGLVAALLYPFTLGGWLPARQAAALRYWLDGSTLRVHLGVYFLKQKAIPLDRVTDVVLAQGPLMRWCGLWALHVQTAGAGQPVAEATLYGLHDPEGVRDQLLRARDAAAARNRAA